MRLAAVVAARKNRHQFPAQEEARRLIYSYRAQYTADYTEFQQRYEFPV
jgi:hypothetical protein